MTARSLTRAAAILLCSMTAFLGTDVAAAGATAKPAPIGSEPATGSRPTAGAPAVAHPPAINAASKLHAPRFVADAARSSLAFTFVQAGAESLGAFKKFSTELRYDEKNLAASSLLVIVQTASLDTQDQDRDTTLKGADLFDVSKFPTAQFLAKSLTRRTDGSFEASGKLTIRGVVKHVRLPLTIVASLERGKPVIDLRGETTIKRLDFGVGQGDWKSTEWVNDAVKISYYVRLAAAPEAPAAKTH
jgi:polyisoprenoid-binding protein YceI